MLSLLLYPLYFVVFYYLVRAPYMFLTGGFKKKTKERNSIMLIFGSGGHTTELLMTFKDYDFKKWSRVYFVKAETDKTSENKIRAFVETYKVILFS